MPDLTNPLVLWGTFLSLARVVLGIVSYVLLNKGWINQDLAKEITGASFGLTVIIWIIYNNHNTQKKLQDAKDDSTTIVITPTTPTPL